MEANEALMAHSLCKPSTHFNRVMCSSSGAQNALVNL